MCQSCEGTAIPCQGPLQCLLLGSYLPPYHLVTYILYALGTAGEIGFSAMQAQGGVIWHLPRAAAILQGHHCWVWIASFTLPELKEILLLSLGLSGF